MGSLNYDGSKISQSGLVTRNIEHCISTTSYVKDLQFGCVARNSDILEVSIPFTTDIIQWLDFSDNAYLEVFEDRIITALDKSGNNKHARQTSNSNRPTRDGVTFDRQLARFTQSASNRLIGVSVPQAQPNHTIYIVCALTSSSANKGFYAITYNNASTSIFSSGGVNSSMKFYHYQRKDVVSPGPSTVTGIETLSTNTLHLVIITEDGINRTIKTNNTAVSSVSENRIIPSGALLKEFYLGWKPSSYIDGWIGDWIMFDGIHTNSQKEQMTSYLSRKWNLTGV